MQRFPAGFSTAKGDLIRSILYPKPVNFRLYREAFRFIVCLALIGILGLVYTIGVYVTRKVGSVRLIETLWRVSSSWPGPAFSREVPFSPATTTCPP